MQLNRNMDLRIFAALAAILLLIPSGCRNEVELGVTAGIDSCRQCNMVIDRVNQACGFVEDGELVVFDSPGCLLRNLDQRKAEGQPIPRAIYFADYESGEWQAADKTFFLLTDHLPTVMNAGVLCFASRAAAEAVQQHPDERVVDWNGYRAARGRADREVEVVVGSAAMNPETIDAEKGELVLLRLRGDGLEKSLEITVQGYSEAGAVTVPATGETVEMRLLLTRPGAGFPVVEKQSGNALGRIRVAGAHTTDEESM